MRLYIATRQNEVIPIDANPSDSILRLQALVVEKQCLEFNSLILDHNRTVQSYNIAPESILQLNIRSQSNYKLYIRIFGGRTFTVNVKQADTVGFVKRQIQAQEPAFLPSAQLLFHNGLLLQGDDRSMRSCNIKVDSLLDLGYYFQPAPSPVVPPSAPVTTTIPSTPGNVGSQHASSPAHLSTQQPHSSPTAQKTQQQQHTNTPSVMQPSVSRISQPAQPGPCSSVHKNAKKSKHSHAHHTHSKPSSSSLAVAPTQPQTQARASIQAAISLPATSQTEIPSSASTPAMAPAPAPAPTTASAPAPAQSPARDERRAIMVVIKIHTEAVKIAINTLDLISALKDKVFKHTNINTTAQSLTYNGIRLLDDRTVGSYQIGEGDSIDMFARPPRPMTKRRAPMEPTTTASLAPAPTSYEGLVHPKKEALPPPTPMTANNFIIDLLSSDEEDEDTSSNSNTRPPSPLPQLTRRINLRMLPEGAIKSFSIPMATNTTIRDVYLSFEDAFGKMAKKRTVVLGGVTLEDDSLLDDYFVDAGTVLNLI